MGHNQVKARPASRSLWGLFKDTFTSRATPLTVLDLLAPATSIPPSLHRPGPRGCQREPALPHPIPPQGRSHHVSLVTARDAAWTRER
jgi:hypothetical protein